MLKTEIWIRLYPPAGHVDLHWIGAYMYGGTMGVLPVLENTGFA